MRREGARDQEEHRGDVDTDAPPPQLQLGRCAGDWMGLQPGWDARRFRGFAGGTVDVGREASGQKSGQG